MRFTPLPVLPAFLLAAPLAAQQFVRNTTSVPSSTGYTEQVDLADVDLDGDWDAVFANGGDFGNQQSTIWINQGGLQGGVLGEFTDETAARFPALARASRDIELGDYDGDGDLDICLVNSSDLTNQATLLWTNMGGIQGGAPGYFSDESFMRWWDLGQSGSSIDPALVIPDQGWVDWGNDVDFADIDADGNLDLVQATSGPLASGRVPTRVFRGFNGFFREFNPSGFQLAGTDIADGDPGLWCQGWQSHDTTDATGRYCDVATTALNADWGDVDGDFDLDLLLGARDEMPRLFRNFASDTAVLAFRDVTGAAFEAGYATGQGHNEECFGDLDDDDDLDVYGVNWRQTFLGFEDQLLRGDGNGLFGEQQAAADSLSDDDSAEPIDYDNDGDLDLMVANFSGQERIVRNDGGWTFSVPAGVMPADVTPTLDTDAADVDGDGDADILCANDQNQEEWLLLNTSQQSDTTPPRIGLLQQYPDREATGYPVTINAHIYDNASLQTSAHYDAFLIYSVQTGVYLTAPMRTAYGQVFRGNLDGSLVGLIGYRAVVTDERGNVGISPWKYFAAGMSGTAFCAGDGSATACPCANEASLGRGCANGLGAGARLVATGVASVSADTLELAVETVPNSSCLFFQGDAQVAGGQGAPFGDGLRCAGGAVWRIGTKIAVENVARYPEAGDAPVSVRGHLPATGGTRYYQVWYRNNADYCTPAAFNLSNGWAVTWGT